MKTYVIRIIEILLLEEKWQFQITYSVQILKERLRASLDQKTSFMFRLPKFFNRKQFIGRVDGDHIFVTSRSNIVLWIWGAGYYYYCGELKECSDGGVLEGTYRINWFWRILMFVYFNVIFIECTIFIFTTMFLFYKYLVSQSDIKSLLMGVVMVFGAIGLFILGRIFIGFIKLVDSQNRKSVYRFLKLITNGEFKRIGFHDTKIPNNDDKKFT